MKKKYFSRVDFQVSILSACLVLVTTLCISFLCYSITYSDMIHSLHDRVNSIYNYVAPALTKEAFSGINVKEDMNKPIYRSLKSLLENIKETTGVMYLYTAKETEDGKLVYVVDGLSKDEDFRYPGDHIEDDIVNDLQAALSGQYILPNRIKVTDWGKIFITYLPVYDGDELIGVIGIEFKAEHQYNTYRILKILAPMICIFFCILAVYISYYAFRRISNPLFQDAVNTDFATKLKNRNSFETDILNLNASGRPEGTALVSIDLNHLKQVNDTLGHSAGDDYISLSAHAIREACGPHMVPYRTGGDEFAVIAQNTSEDKLKEYLRGVEQNLAKNGRMEGITLSLSMGASLFDPGQDKNLYDTYKRADYKMYQAKKEFHAQDRKQ